MIGALHTDFYFSSASKRMWTYAKGGIPYLDKKSTVSDLKSVILELMIED